MAKYTHVYVWAAELQRVQSVDFLIGVSLKPVPSYFLNLFLLPFGVSVYFCAVYLVTLNPGLCYCITEALSYSYLRNLTELFTLALLFLVIAITFVYLEH